MIVKFCMKKIKTLPYFRPVDSMALSLAFYAGDRHARNLYKKLVKVNLSTRNLNVCHSDLQQDFSCASFLHKIEHVVFDARNLQSRDSAHAC